MESKNLNVNEEIKNNCIATAQNKLNEFQTLEADTIERIENSDASLIDKRKMTVRVYKAEIEVLNAFDEFNDNVSVNALKVFISAIGENESILYSFCTLNRVQVLRQMEEEEAKQKEMLINFINKF